MTSLLPSPSRKVALEEATSLYQSNLAGAVEYLQGRGITQAAAEAARLGFVSAPASEDHERFAGRLAIPYLTATCVVGIKFRCIEHEDCKAVGCVKYLCEDGFHPRLYGVTSLLERAPRIVVVEGEINALATRYLASAPCVGAPGASTWQPFWSRLFIGYEEVIVTAHGDDAGLTFAKTVVEGSSQRRIQPLDNGRIVRMPSGEDENSMIVNEGAERFRERLGL